MIPRNGAAEDPGGGATAGDTSAAAAYMGGAGMPGNLQNQPSQMAYDWMWQSVGAPDSQYRAVQNFLSIALNAGGYGGGGAQTTAFNNGIYDIKLDLDDGKIALQLSGFQGSASAENKYYTLLEQVTRPENKAAAVQALAQAGLLSGGGGPPAGKLESGTTDSLTAENVTIDFAPSGNKDIVVTTTGNLRLAGTLTGVGSLTAEKDIKIVGLGTDFQTNPDGADMVSLYAKGSITFSTLQEKPNNAFAYKDVRLKGTVFAWGDITAKLANPDSRVNRWGRFELEGAMVAYGKNMDTDTPNGLGTIAVEAEGARLTYDPRFLANLLQSIPSTAKFQRLGYHLY